MKRNWDEDDNIADRVLYGLIKMLGVLVRSISRKKSTRIAFLIGDFLYKILKIRRHLQMAAGTAVEHRLIRG